MVDGVLYEKVPVPDVVLAQHVMPFQVGRIALKEGTTIVAADSFMITIFGRGGHGSMPQLCIDPLVLRQMSYYGCKGLWQESRSGGGRSVDDRESAGGPDGECYCPKAVLKIDIRSQHAGTRGKALKAMRRIVTKVSSACSHLLPGPGADSAVGRNVRPVDMKNSQHSSRYESSR